MSVIILAGTLRVPEEKIDAVHERLPAMIAASRAEAGIVVYSLAWDPLEPDLLRVFEVYRDYEALEAHRATPHLIAWRLLTQGFVRDLHVFDASPRLKT